MIVGNCPSEFVILSAFVIWPSKIKVTAKQLSRILFCPTAQMRSRWPQCTTKIVIVFILWSTVSCTNNQATISNHVEGARTDKDGNCFINTGGVPDANGIDMDVYYPCSWSDIHTDHYLTSVIKQIGDTPEGIKANIALIVMVSKIKDTLNPELFDSLRSNIYLTGKLKLEPGTISADTIEINGLKGGSVITRNLMESGQVAYGLNIHLYFKNNIIQLRYVVGAPTEDEAVSYFHKQQPLLLRLARKTRFHNMVSQRF